MEFTKLKAKGSADGEIEVEVELKGATPNSPSRAIVIIQNGTSSVLKEIPVNWES